MNKMRMVWIAAAVVAVAVVALILLLPGSGDLAVRHTKAGPLGDGQPVAGAAWPQDTSVQKGDVLLYTIEVLYDPGQVTSIDRSSLDENVNFEPFEVIDFEEAEYKLSSGMRLYQREYSVQLMGSRTEYEYEFPSIVVLYELRDVSGYAETSLIPEPVYVSSRLQANMYEIIEELGEEYNPLRPLAGEVEGSAGRWPWLFWSLGGLLLVVAITDISMRVMPRWREQKAQEGKTPMGEQLAEAYTDLCENAERGANPRSLMHQMDHILRMALVDKENFSWLEDPDLCLVTEEIKPTVISLADRCLKASGSDDTPQSEVQKAMQEINQILEYYYAGEAEAWRR